jgi:fucose 4-O-acetylase-like acetyltransferase
LVVFGHAAKGFVDAEPSASALLMPPVDVVYGFRMPLFFLLAGLLAPRTLALRPPAFAGRMATRLVYPFYLWSFILLVVHGLASDYTNGQSSLSSRAPTLHFAWPGRSS